MARVWILQANPRMYDVDTALRERDVIYWRIPQYVEQVHEGDRALFWRSGKEAGFVGYGVIRAEPAHYDLSKDNDPYFRGGFGESETDAYAPVWVNHGAHISKDAVASVLPAHRIITAPMGTVFPLDTDDVAAIDPLLLAAGYDLRSVPPDGFVPFPVLPEVKLEPVRPVERAPVPARITPALFLLSSTPQRPVEITIEGDALRLLLVERDALRSLNEEWDAVGIYVLVGRPNSDEAVLSAYVGKAQGLRSRIRTGHVDKLWTRCVMVQREGLHAFNASDISWLERRLVDVLLEAPQVDLVNKTPPPVELVPDYKAEILERTVVAVLGVLGVLGAYVE